jgi:hypothetical protein
MRLLPCLCLLFAPLSLLSVAQAEDMPSLPGMEMTTQTDGKSTTSQTVSHVCGSNGSPDVVVNGMNSTVSLTGDCGEVLVNGTTMKVNIGSVKTLTVGGMSNAVVYSKPKGGDTVVTDGGMANVIKAK